MKRIFAVVLAIVIMMVSCAFAQLTVVGKSGDSFLRKGPGLNYEKDGALKKGETLAFLGDISTDDRGVEWYLVDSEGEELWVSSRYTVIEGESEEASEGAPIVDRNRMIDLTVHDDLEIAGRYEGVMAVEMNMYTDTDDNFVGVMCVMDEDGNELYEGEMIKVDDNWYELYGEYVSVSVYSFNERLYLDLYIDGEHTDYLSMIEHFVS